MAGGVWDRSGGDLLRYAIWSACGLILAASLLDMRQTVKSLATDVSDMKTSVAVVKEKIASLPPDDLVFRVKTLEEWKREITAWRNDQMRGGP